MKSHLVILTAAFILIICYVAWTSSQEIKYECTPPEDAQKKPGCETKGNDTKGYRYNNEYDICQRSKHDRCYDNNFYFPNIKICWEQCVIEKTVPVASCVNDTETRPCQDGDIRGVKANWHYDRNTQTCKTFDFNRKTHCLVLGGNKKPTLRNANAFNWPETCVYACGAKSAEAGPAGRGLKVLKVKGKGKG